MRIGRALSVCLAIAGVVSASGCEAPSASAAGAATSGVAASPPATTAAGQAVGLRWQEIRSPLGNWSAPEEVVFAGVGGPAGLLVLGAMDDPEGAQAFAWVTTDGTGWQPVEPPFRDGQMLPDVLYATQREYIAITPDADMNFEVRASVTGERWQRLGAFSGLDDIGASATLDTVHLLCGHADDGTRCAFSADDARTWEILDGPPGQAVETMAAIGGRFLAAGSDELGISLWESADGRSWREIAVGGALDTVSSGWVGSLAADAHGVVLAGSAAMRDRRHGDRIAGALWSSDDGRAWHAANLGELTANSFGVTTVTPGYVAFGAQIERHNVLPAEILVSLDGRRWRASDPPSDRMLRPIGAHAGFILVREDPEDASIPAHWLRAEIVPLDEPWPLPPPSPVPTAAPTPPVEEAAPNVAWSKPVDVGVGQVNDVTQFDGRFVAVGREPEDAGGGPAVWLSADGLAWQRVDTGAVFDQGTLETVAAGRGRLIAAGSVAGDAGPGAAFWWSDDAVTWHRAQGDPATDRLGLPMDEPQPGVHAVTFGPDAFVAVGSAVDGGRAWRSTDGRSWQLVDSFEGWPWGVAYRDGYVAVGGVGLWRREGRLWTSRGGSDWQEATGAIDGQELTAVDATDLTTIVGAVGPGAWISDGERWTWAPDQPDLDAGTFTDVAVVPGGFAAVGSAPCGSDDATCPTIWVSTGGFRWTAIVRSTISGGGAFEAATVAGDVIVALENGPDERIRAWVGRIR